MRRVTNTIPAHNPPKAPEGLPCRRIAAVALTVSQRRALYRVKAAELCLCDLHDRLRGCDRTALDTLAERILPALRRQLGRAFGSATEDMANDAAVDALLEYAGRPAGFRVSLGVPLDRFLYKVAWRNLADLMDAAKRRRARETTYAQHSHIAYTTRDFADRLPQPVRAQLFKAAVNDAERAALRLLLDDAEPRTRPLATALGVDHLPVSEQQREVKRFKDRLVKRCIRLAGRQP